MDLPKQRSAPGHRRSTNFSARNRSYDSKIQTTGFRTPRRRTDRTTGWSLEVTIRDAARRRHQPTPRPRHRRLKTRSLEREHCISDCRNSQAPTTRRSSVDSRCRIHSSHDESPPRLDPIDDQQPRQFDSSQSPAAADRPDFFPMTGRSHESTGSRSSAVGTDDQLAACH